MKKHAVLGLMLSFFFGFLAALPLVFGSIPYLSFLLFAPYFLYLRTRREETRLGFYYLSGLFFFLGYYMCAFSFFAAMYPLDFAGLQTGASIAVILAAMLLLPLFQAWFSAFSILLLGLLRKKTILRFPFAFSLAAAALYTIFAFAQNFTWAGVPWANTAVGLASSPLLIQSASLFGSSFLVFLIILINAAIAEAFVAFRECRDKAALISLACAAVLFLGNILTGAVLLSIDQEGDRTMTVAVIQGNAPSTENSFFRSHLNRCEKEALAAADEADVDLMLWSESVVTHALQEDEYLQEYFSSLAKQTGAIQMVGAFSSTSPSGEEEGFYNSLFLFYPDGTMSEETYAKRRPVPFGEYVPMKPVFETLIPALTDISMLSRDTTAGTDEALFHTEQGTLGGLICFDSIYPALARKSTVAGAELLLLSTDDSWFDGSFAKDLHLRHGILRAVENGRALVRTGNTGISAIADTRGNLLASAPIDAPAHAIATVSLSSHRTLYSLTGDLVPYLSLAFLIALPLATIISQRKRKDKAV